MQVAASVMLSLAACTSPRRLGLATKSTLLTIRILVAAISASFAATAIVSSSSPRLASTIRATMSASWAPLQATATMARSRRRRGAKMPGVSTKMSCASPSIAMPRMIARVVCTLGLTIVTLLPTIALTRVDLPTLGAPMTATKPQRRDAALWSALSTACSGGSCGVSLISPGRFHAFAGQHRGGGGLFGGALGAAHAFGRHEFRQFDGDAELRIVMRPGAGDFPIRGRRQAARLGPLLQHGLGIAKRTRRRAQPLAP